MAYQITEKCARCGTCKDQCPQEAISAGEAGKPYKIDADLCVDCGACESSCPESAIIAG